MFLTVANTYGSGDARFLSFLAAKHSCAAYLQAKLESKEQITGLELSGALYKLPSLFWGSSSRRQISWVVDILLAVDPTGLLEEHKLKLKTCEILLQVNFAPRRYGERILSLSLRLGHRENSGRSCSPV